MSDRPVIKAWGCPPIPPGPPRTSAGGSSGAKYAIYGEIAFVSFPTSYIAVHASELTESKIPLSKVLSVFGLTPPPRVYRPLNKALIEVHNQFWSMNQLALPRPPLVVDRANPSSMGGVKIAKMRHRKGGCPTTRGGTSNKTKEAKSRLTITDGPKKDEGDILFRISSINSFFIWAISSSTTAGLFTIQYFLYFE